MKLSRRGFCSGALAAAGVLGLAGCSGSKPEAGNRLTVGLSYIPNIQFSPFYVGLSEGIFAKLGLDVELRHHGAQEDLFGALNAGKEQVVFASSDEGMVAAANTPELKTFATCYQRYPSVVIVPAASPIKTLAELRGRTLGIPGHFGSSYYAALAALHVAGLGKADVKLQDIGYTQVSALTQAKVEAIIGFSNNEAVQFETLGFATRQLAVLDTGAPNLVGPGLLTLAGKVEAEVLRKLVQGVKQAEELILQTPELALKATREYVPTLAAAEQQQATKAVLAATSQLWRNPAGKLSLAVDEAAFTRMGEFLVKAGITATPPAPGIIKL